MLKYLLALLLAIVCLATLSSGKPCKDETDAKVEVKNKPTPHYLPESPQVEEASGQMESDESANTEKATKAENEGEGDKKQGYRQWEWMGYMG